MTLADQCCILWRDFLMWYCIGEQGLHAAKHACGGGHPEGKCGREDRIERAPVGHFSARKDYIAARRLRTNTLHSAGDSGWSEDRRYVMANVKPAEAKSRSLPTGPESAITQLATNFR